MEHTDKKPRFTEAHAKEAIDIVTNSPLRAVQIVAAYLAGELVDKVRAGDKWSLPKLPFQS